MRLQPLKAHSGIVRVETVLIPALFILVFIGVQKQVGKGPLILVSGDIGIVLLACPDFALGSIRDRLDGHEGGLLDLDVLVAFFPVAWVMSHK